MLGLGSAWRRRYVDCLCLLCYGSYTDTMVSCKSVFIRDGGSMHGTWVNEKKIPVNQDVTINSGDVLTFGADVTRGTGGFLNSPRSHLHRAYGLC